MPPTSSRLRRVVLRSIVLVQLALLALVAFSAGELVTFGSEVTPGSVALMASMLAATAVALRVSFQRGAGTREDRLAFMAAQAFVSVAPLLGQSVLGFVAAGSTLPPNQVFGPRFMVLMMGVELLLASVLAAVSALLCPLLLASPEASRAGRPLAPIVGLWAGGGVVVAVLVTVLYDGYFAEAQKPETRVQQLLGADEDEVRWSAARHLAAMDLKAQPDVRSALFEGLDAPGSVDRAWAAYVLVAAGVDDGRAMSRLREMIGTFAVGRAAYSLSLLGAAAAPALPELSDLVRRPTSDTLVARVQVDAAEALGGIGPPASGAVPFLLARTLDLDYPELRFAAGYAIDRIDPGFARRCAINAATMLDALTATNLGPLTIRPECLPTLAAPSGALSANH